MLRLRPVYKSGWADKDPVINQDGQTKTRYKSGWADKDPVKNQDGQTKTRL